MSDPVDLDDLEDLRSRCRSCEWEGNEDDYFTLVPDQARVILDRLFDAERERDIIRGQLALLRGSDAEIARGERERSAQQQIAGLREQIRRARRELGCSE